MVQPKPSNAPMPHPDLPKELKDDYKEAQNIISYSPRGAMALLRLLIEKLTNSILGQKKGKDLNDNIGILVERGLPKDVKKRLDIIRVTGNEAVHPGKIDNRDSYKNALMLFKMVNLVVERVITDPKNLELDHNDLSEGSKKAIERRDKRDTSKKSK